MQVTDRLPSAAAEEEAWCRHRADTMRSEISNYYIVLTFQHPPYVTELLKIRLKP